MGKSKTCAYGIAMPGLVCAILFMYASFLGAFLPGLLKPANDAKTPIIGDPKMHVPLISGVFLLVVINFSLAHLCSPGRVPSKFPWDPTKIRSGNDGEPPQVFQIERKMDGSARYCRICGKYKPDRTHHCRQCGLCTLEMDHHCPYINNCVGYLNHKYFFLVLFYGACSLIMYSVVMRFKFMHAVKNIITLTDVLILFMWMFAIAFSCLILPFFGFHCWLVTNNYTTLEFCEKLRAKDSKKFKNGQKVKDVYKTSLFNKGGYLNICHFLGPNPLFWLIPVRWGMSNDGTQIPASRISIIKYYKALGLGMPKGMTESN